MSGSGGGGGGTGGGPGVVVDEGDPCETVDFTAHLQSPDPSVLAQLNVGMELEVVLEGHAVAVRAAVGVAGYLTQQIARLLRCLQAGYVFRAEVQTLSGGAVRVRVYSV